MRHANRLSLPTAMGAILATLAITASAGAQTVQSGHRETLLDATSSWNGKPYGHYPAGRPEMLQIRLTLAPHTALPWHTHPYPNVGYVLEGALTIHDRASGQVQTFHQGQSFAESVDDGHRGESGDKKTVILLTYAATPGVAPSVPMKGEQAEY